MRETIIVLLLIIIVTSGLFFMSRSKLDISITSFTGWLVLEPSIEFSIKDLRFQLRFEEPCSVTISGSIMNTGNADAEEVVVDCLTQDKELNPLGIGADYIGDLEKGSVKNFLISMNTMCMEEMPPYECKADCSNC
jgi:hypothetical protein